MTTTPTDHPLSTDELAAVIARDIPAGAFVNLGIGQPTRIADHLPADSGVVLHTENGMLNMGPKAEGDAIDPDLTNAGKVPVTELPGAAYFHHADSFAMMRGGHLDVCVLGAYQVAFNGDLANVMMTLFTRSGEPKLVPRCTYPLTGLGCVSRVYTDHGVFDVGPEGVRIRETYGIEAHELAQRLGIPSAQGTGGIHQQP